MFSGPLARPFRFIGMQASSLFLLYDQHTFPLSIKMLFSLSRFVGASRARASSSLFFHLEEEEEKELYEEEKNKNSIDTAAV